MTNVKSLLALYVKMGGSLTDTYSDIAGGIPVGQYSLISDAILACSKKYSSGGGSYTLPTASADTKGGVKIGSGLSMDGEVLSATGGGAEKFVVTLTADDSGAETVWTADKTVAEIVAAYEANKIVVCKVTLDVMPCELPVKSVAKYGDDDDDIVIFCGTYNDGEAAAVGTCVLFGTECLVETTPITTNAPLIVTLTEDQNTGNLVGDKTYREVNTALDGGQTVTFKGDISSTSFACNALSCGYSNAGGPAEYSVALVFGGSVIEAEGAENDYVTLTMN